ncbi:hypothetical protein WG66_000951, partial [Moniliophthora roreri]
FSTHPGYNEARHDSECSAFISALTRHLDRTNFTSYVVTSTRGQEFIRFVHEQVISQCLHEPYGWDSDERRELMSAWSRVTQRVEEIGHLPSGYFAPIPGYSEKPVDQAMNASIPTPSVDPDHLPRADGRNGALQSDHETNDDSQGVPGLVERGK